MPDTAQSDVNDSTAAPPLPYRIPCACGRELVGTRGPQAVIVACSKCAVKTLVFPSSPLATLRGPLPDVAATSSSARFSIAAYRRPLVAGGIALVIVIAGLVLLLNSNWFRSSSADAMSEDKRRQHVAAARGALDDADFAKATAEFRLARQTLPPESTAPEARWFEQMEKETAVMSELSSETLEEVLLLAKGLSDRAWGDLFRTRYRNKPFIFDAQIQSAGGGVFRLEYVGLVAGQPVHVEIHDSRVLRNLSVEWPARMILGLRLAETRRDSRGRWLVLADPDAIVLFTNGDCFRGSSITADDEFEATLRRQSGLLDITPP